MTEDEIRMIHSEIRLEVGNMLTILGRLLEKLNELEGIKTGN